MRGRIAVSGAADPKAAPHLLREEDASAPWSVFEQFFVLSYRAGTETPILVSQVSPGGAAILGTTPETIVNDPGGYARLLHPHDRERVLDEHRMAAASGERLVSEYRLVGKDDTVIWIYDKAMPVVDSLGRATLYGHCLDITPRKSTEAELHDTEAHFRSVVANIPGVVYRCACDEEWTMRFMSDHIEDLVGYPASDFIGNKVRRYGSIIHHEDRPYVIVEVEKALERGSPYTLEYRLIHRDGTPKWIAERGRAILGPDGRRQWLDGVLLDITRQKAAEESRDAAVSQLRHQALHDSLTGLPNRTLFLERLAEAIELARADGTELAVFMLDLDRFKEVNDTLGHASGDRLLQEMARRLQDVLRTGDLIARLGGDEFAVLVRDAPRVHVLEVVRRVLAASEGAFVLNGLPVTVEASIGVARYPADGSDVDLLLQRADTAMYVAKDTNSGYEFYDASVDTHASNRLALIAELRQALEARELVLYYQPKVSVQSGTVAGVEALVRWHHPSRGLVMPDDFIPVVQGTSLVKPLTLYVIEEALHQWRDWADEGRPLPVAVNLSMRNLLDPAFPGELATLLGKWHVPAAMLKLEITESTIVDEGGRTKDVLDRLGAMGLRLSVDDFGTGYSSLAYLKRLPIDEIKIDRSFVSAMTSREEDRIIVKSTIDLGRNLGLEVVAEGVETRAIMERLDEFGCDVAQGYYLGRPVPADELSAWLDANMLPRQPQGHQRKFRDGQPMQRRRTDLDLTEGPGSSD
jgi:diguanylate cyclase (GGDEF)-like protein/PAS domain S-box-containing protein